MGQIFLQLVCVAVVAAFTQFGQFSDQDLRDDFRRPDVITFPEDAPYSPQVAALGKKLFFDPRLSGAQNMSCASCHNPSFGWETPAARTIGAMNEPLDRHAPTIENLAEAKRLHWDGRVGSLEEQASQPITHPKEMNNTIDDVVERLSLIPEYKSWFEHLFDDGITGAAVVQSIATYERTLRSGHAPFDDWVDGDEGAISEQARAGLDLFTGKAKCAACHSGWAFTDHDFHDIGLDTDDIGRGKYEPDNIEAQFAFKTPTLRNVAIRAPYMHRGNLQSLRDVLHHYNDGGLERPSKSDDVTQLDLSEAEMDAIIAFLETLSANDVHVTTPALPPEVPE